MVSRSSRRTRTLTAFQRANRLWNREGRTAAALALYERAAREQADDPVVAYQCAVALQAIDRFDAAARMADRARSSLDRLEEASAEALQSFLRALSHPPRRSFPQYPPQLLDRDSLAKLRDQDWRAIADAASERRMYGVANYAIERWQGVPLDPEDARDLEAVADAGSLHQSVLSELSASLRR